MLRYPNYDTYEFSPLKLLFNSHKCENIINILKGKIDFDPTLPISIELHLTNKCNLACEWCVDQKIRKGGKSLAFDSLIRLLDDLEDKNVGLTIEGGGEPTLYSFFEDFVIEANRRGISLGLITNGVYPIKLSLLHCFRWLRISVDASTPEEYIIEKGGDGFSNVISNIKRMCEAKKGTILGVSYVLTKRNCKWIPTFLNTMQTLGLDYVQFRNVEENTHLKLEKEQMDELGKEIEQKFTRQTLCVRLDSHFRDVCANNNLSCVAHSLRSIIHADGDVLLCEKRRHDAISIGNINTDSFLDIWNASARRHATKKLLNPESQKGCTECRIASYNQLFADLCRVKTIHFI